MDNNEKKSGAGQQPNKKLTYEQLEAYANQMTGQMQQMQHKMMQMNNALQQANRQNLYQEIHFGFKVLEFADRFNPDMVAKVVKKLEEVLTPVEEPKEETPEQPKED